MASEAASIEQSGFVDNWQSGKTLAECNLHMLTSEDSCDVSFRVGKNEKRVRAHRYILISRSCVFHAMLCGPLAEKEDIKIPDVEENIFSEMLRFLYANDSTLTSDNVTGLLYLSKKYALGGLERLCLTYLDASLSPDNACVILEQAHIFDEKDLYDKAFKSILQNGEVSITNPGFKDLCHTCLDKVVKSEDLKSVPNNVFNAVLAWANAECGRLGKDTTPENQRQVLGQTVFDVPFTQMDAKEFAKNVVPSGLLSGEESTKLFCFFSLSDVDVTPFKVKSKQQSSDDVIRKKYHEVPVYTEVETCSSSQLYSFLLLEPNGDISLRGFTAYGSGSRFNYRYEVKIEDLTPSWSYREILKTQISGKHNSGDNIEIQLSKPCLLQSASSYRVYVKTLEGESKCCGIKLKSAVNFGSCEIKVEYSENDYARKGLISNLLLEETCYE